MPVVTPSMIAHRASLVGRAPDKPLGVAMLSFAHVHAGGYADAVTEDPRTQIRVVWDEVPERGRDRADHYGVPYEPSLEVAVGRDDVDAVVVNSMTNNHHEVYFAAVNAGKHIFTEKALTVTVADADRVVEAVDGSGIKFMISLPSRCDPQVLWLRGVVDSGILGDVTYIRTRIAHQAALDHWFGGHNAWFADKEAAGGGGLFDLGCHTVDITRWLGGPPKSVVAQMNSFSGTYPTVDDNAVGVVEFESGALGTMECAWVQRRGPNPIEVYGTEGYAGIRTAGRGPVLHAPGDPEVELPEAPPSPMDQWLSAILNDTDMTITVRDGRNLTEMLEGCYRSDELGARVEFPLE